MTLFNLNNHFKRLFFYTSLILFVYISKGQCPDKRFLKLKISSVDSPENINNNKNLNDLTGLCQQIKDCGLEHDSVNMFLLQKIGKLYFKQDDFIRAVNFTTTSISIAKDWLKKNPLDILSITDGYYNLQYYFGKMNQLQKKYDAIDSCIEYSVKGNILSERNIIVLLDKTNYLFNKGEYAHCIRDAKLALYFIPKYYYGKYNIEYVIAFSTHIVNALIYSYDFDKAEQVLIEQKKSFENTRNTKYLGWVYGFLGQIEVLKKNYFTASAHFKKAYQKFKIIDNKSGCAEILANTGMLYAKGFHQLDKGLNYCNAALKYADAADSLFILKETGNIYVQKKMFDKAQDYFQQAFNTIQPDLNETTILQSSFMFPGFNVLQSLLDLMTEKADAFFQQYLYTKNISFLNTAIGIYKKGDLFLAKIKADQQLQLESNLIWRNTAHILYEHAIEACYTNKDIENAFYFFEKSRSILLNDQINEQRWMADSDIAKQAQLKKDILELQTSLTSFQASSQAYSDVQKKLYTSSQQLDVLLRSIKNKNPLFYKDYLDTSFITLVDLKEKILQNSKSLLEIFTGDSAVYVLTVTPNSNALIKINKQSYDSLTDLYISFIAHPDLLNKDFNGFVQTAQKLYRLIFENNVPPNGSIIISPDGKNFPFESLVTDSNNQQPNYLLNSYATSYTYSVKYLTNQFAPASSNITVLGFAPVQYKNNSNLVTLTGSDNSLLHIKNYFSDATNFTYENATKRNFLQNFPNYGILQLYTHAADSSDKKDPVIYFADSALYLSALIPDRKPVTQLVILSACETAIGALYRGEGIFSFNRGFAAMGIPAAVSNLWSVDNQSTYIITELFYKYLKQRLPTDVALQKAKQEFIASSVLKQKKLPYYWAAPILVGRVDTLKTDKKNIAGFLIASLLLIVAGIVLYKYILKKRTAFG